MVHWQQKFYIVFFRLLQKLLSQIQLVVLHKGFPNPLTLGLEKGVSHAAADDQSVHLGHQVLDHGNLIADLRTTQNRHKRLLGIPQSLAHVIEFFLHEQPSRGFLYKLGDSSG